MDSYSYVLVCYWFMIAVFLFSCCSSQLLSEEVDKVSISIIRSVCGYLCLSEKISICLKISPHSHTFPLQAEHELRVAQTEFDRQAEVTRLLLEGISSTHVSMRACVFHSVSQQFWKSY